ncbi:SbcC/MukB-like Walker B domain-containing protein [Bacillus spongiae]|uniref:Nuclease SbcCD subunit C n=1 Tax=Bacillus spongiae TaxID=2683610 RepID=A0ABU8HBR6_9BACI
MKPLRLTMQAFGPYAGIEVIDFTQLQSRTMFVVSGKTGSGKTTIFDGISFAIYGKASGDNRIGLELRSQFAKADVLTEVHLVFSLKGKTYEIRRSPQQERKKTRGDGFRLVNATAELYQYNEDGEKVLIAASIRETDEKISEIIQLDANQFRQILMLPQGEFRKLLIADSKDKEQILQKLFHTEFYQAIQEKLREQATDLRQSVEHSSAERSRLLKNADVSNLEELSNALTEDEVNVSLILPLLSEEIQLMKTKLDKREVERKNVQKNRDELQQKMLEERNRLAQFEQRATLQHRLEQLNGMTEVFTNKEKEVKLAQKAALLQKQDELCLRLKKELDKINSKVKQLQQDVEQGEKAQQEAESMYQAEVKKDSLREKALNEKNHLMSLQNAVESYSSQKVATEKLQLRVQELTTKSEQKEDSLKGLIQEMVKMEEQLTTLSDIKLQAVQLDRQIEKNDGSLKSLRQYSDLIEKKRSLTNNLTNILDRQEYQQKVLADHIATFAYLEEQWKQAQASILAKQLVENNACPVCGSEHHPQPALEKLKLPSEGELNAAKEAVSKAEVELANIERERITLESKQASLKERMVELEEDISDTISTFSSEGIEELIYQKQSERDRLIRATDKIHKQIQSLEQLTHEFQKVKARKEKEELAKEQLHREREEAHANYLSQKASLQHLEQQVPEHLRIQEHFKEVLNVAERTYRELVEVFELSKEKLQHATQSLQVLKVRMADANDQVAMKEAELQEERNLFVSILAKEGFENYKAYTLAKRSEEQIEYLEKEIRQFHEEKRSVTDQISVLNRALGEALPPKIEETEKQMKECEELLAVLQEQVMNMKQTIQHNESIVKAVLEINETIKELEETYKIIGHLAEIARGQNTHRITFERYVLASFLDDILQVANGRLTKMTSGRYQLLRKMDRARGNVQSGLEILVFDQYTGQERHVKTLSGGESFKASLALALGLADVVQQHAGGVSLETIFIDEGFGTLDPESLDHAVEALMDIQSSGRLVGVISHVPELKERIDARLEVVSTQAGSTTHFVLR